MQWALGFYRGVIAAVLAFRELQWPQQGSRKFCFTFFGSFLGYAGEPSASANLIVASEAPNQ